MQMGSPLLRAVADKLVAGDSQFPTNSLQADAAIVVAGDQTYIKGVVTLEQMPP